MGSFISVVDYGRPAALSPRQVLEQMAGAHGSTLAQSLLQVSDGWAALGFVPERFQPEPRSVFDRNGRYVVFIEGEIINRASVAASARVPITVLPQMSLPALVHRAFRSRGTALFAELDGAYRIAVWDRENRSLLVASDRFGLYPIYYSEESRRVFVASELRPILLGRRGNPDFDRQAIIDLLGFGHLLDDRTLFENIRRLPEGHFLSISEKTVELKRFVDVQDPLPAAVQNQGEAIRKLRSAIMTSVKAHSDSEPTAILLTGGLDSRLIAAAQQRLGYRVTTYATGDSYSAQAMLAGRTATALGAEHRFQALTPMLYLESLQRTVWLSAGMVSAARGLRLGLIPLLREHPRRLLDSLQPLDGRFRLSEFGLWCRQRWSDEARLDLACRLFHCVFCAQNPKSLSPVSLILPEFYKDAVPARERLRQLIASTPFAGLPPRELLIALNRALRIRYGAVPVLNLLRHYVRLSTPLYTFSVLHIVESLPLKWQSGDKILIKKIIAEINPELARIPWQQTMLPAHAPLLLEYLAYGLQAVNGLLHFAPARPKQNTLLQRAPFFDFGAHLRNDRTFYIGIKSMLIDNLAREIFDKTAVARYFLGAMRQGGQLHELLARVLTINLWYRYYLEEHSPAELLHRAPNLKNAA